MREWAERALSGRQAARRPAADRGRRRRARARGLVTGATARGRDRIARRRRRSSMSLPRRRARAPARRRGQPRRRRALPRPLRGGATRTPSARWPSAAPPGRATRSRSSSRRSGRVWRAARQAGRGGELLDGAIEAARLLGNTQALVWSLLNRSLAALAAGDVELALATAEESVDLSADAGRELSRRRRRPLALAAALLETGDAAARGRAARSAPPAARSCRSIPGSLAGQLPRAAHALLARARPPGRGRTRGRAAREAWAAAVQLPMARSPGPIARRRPSRSTPATRSRAAEHALASAAAADEVGRRSRPRCRGRSPAARSPSRRARPRAQPSCERAAARLRRRAARSATATRPSASCESSATASTGARARARPTGPASSR